MKTKSKLNPEFVLSTNLTDNSPEAKKARVAAYLTANGAAAAIKAIENSKKPKVKFIVNGF